MKQRLVPADLQELTYKQKKAFRKWAVKQERKNIYPDWFKWHAANLEPTTSMYDVLPILTVGEMITFLDDHDINLDDYPIGPAENLCDDLWMEVKEVLSE